MQDTITGSLILDLLMSNNEPNPPILPNPVLTFLFWSFFLVSFAICLTKSLAAEIFTPLFL